MRTPYLAALLPAVIGAILGFLAYAAPLGNTGVDGTLGALLALVGAVATVVGTGLALAFALPPRLLGLLNVLSFLAAALTALAAYFLMQYALAIAMLAAIFGLVFALVLTRNRRRRVA